MDSTAVQSAAERLHALLTQPEPAPVRGPRHPKFALEQHNNQVWVTADGQRRPFRVLAVCERGNSRSHAMTWLLKDCFGVESIACGIRAVGAETWQLLYDWADIVVLMHAPLLKFIPSANRDKIVICEVGPDVYWRVPSSTLCDLCERFIKSEHLLGPDAVSGRVLRDEPC